MIINSNLYNTIKIKSYDAIVTTDESGIANVIAYDGDKMIPYTNFISIISLQPNRPCIGFFPQEGTYYTACAKFTYSDFEKSASNMNISLKIFFVDE